MNIESLRELALSFPGVEEYLPFGPDNLAFKIDQKIFLLIPLDISPLRFNVKCDPDVAIQYREKYASVLPGYHMNKKHWNTVIDDGSIPDSLIKKMVEDSYALVAKDKTYCKK